MKNFLFDIYGTLIDILTDEGSPAFRKRFLSECGSLFGSADFFSEYFRLIAAEEAKDEYREADVLKIFCDIARIGGNELSEGEALKAALIFRKLSTKKFGVYPHVLSTLSKLKAAGGRIYIVSNAQTCFTLDELKRTGIDRIADGIELSSSFGYKKPSGRFFNYAIDKYGLDRSESIYIGNDISADILGARGAGLKTVYIHTSISPASDTFGMGEKEADYAVKNHAELKKLLLSLVLEKKLKIGVDNAVDL